MAGGESVGFIDLDAVLAPPIKVKLEGKEWKLPGDAPTELLLSIVLLSEQAQEAIDKEDTERMMELRAEMSERIEDLFAMHQEVPEGFGSQLVDAQIGELVSKLFEHYYSGGDEEDGDRPTPAAATPPSSRSSARSRPSSSRARKPRAKASSAS